jgi:hypothetical protein
MGRVLVVVAVALLAVAGWLAFSPVHADGFACGKAFGDSLVSDFAVTQAGVSAHGCDSARLARKTWTVGLGLAGLALGAGGVVVSRREVETAPR